MIDPSRTHESTAFGHSHRYRRRCVSLDDVWAAEPQRLRRELLATTDAARRVEVFELFLWRQLAGSAQLHPAVAFALATLDSRPAAPTIGSITRAVGLSSRRFITLFADQVGLTPKTYSRVTRFQRLIRDVQAVDLVDWAGLALRHGYFDQAHLVHEFAAFSGMSPTAYLKRRPGSAVP